MSIRDMTNRSTLAFALLVLAIAQLSRAQVIYVNNVVGDDRNDGRSSEPTGPGVGPVATLERAFQLARAGETIQLVKTDQPYTGSMVVGTPGRGGIEGHPVVLEGNGVQLRGFAPVPPSVWQYLGHSTYRMQPYRKGYYLLLVDGKPVERVPYRRAQAGSDRPALDPLQWTVRDGHVYLRIPPGSYIDQLLIEIPGSDIGLSLYSVKHLIIRNLTITGYRLDGLHVHGQSHDVVLENVTARLNGRAGIAVGGTARVTARGCQTEANLVADVYAYGSCRLELRDSRLLGGGSYLVWARGGHVGLNSVTLGTYRKSRFFEQGGRIEELNEASGQPQTP